VIGCGGGSSCNEVLSSRWSAIGGILPVSGLAAGVYLAMLLASFFIGPATEAPVRQLAWRAMLLLVGAAAGSAVWFIVVQKWFIGAFCPYCMTAHVTSLVLAALVISQAPRQLAVDSTSGAPTTTPSNAKPDTETALPVAAISPPAGPRVFCAGPVAGMASVGLALAGIMAVGQVIFSPPPVSRGGESHVKNSTFLDPRTVPLVGSLDARHIVDLLFDYNCPHCQKLHAMLDETIRRYDGQLAFALCPVPLNPRCNPFVPAELDAFKDSCELARIALTVWVAKRDAFSTFDRWMFTPEPDHLWHPRTVGAAWAKAIELVGVTSFNASRSDPWIERHLQNSIQLYGENGANAVPKIVFRQQWVTPQPKNADDFVAMLRERLVLPPP
jgi:uncharacterized membrane protein